MLSVIQLRLNSRSTLKVYRSTLTKCLTVTIWTVHKESRTYCNLHYKPTLHLLCFMIITPPYPQFDRKELIFILSWVTQSALNPPLDSINIVDVYMTNVLPAWLQTSRSVRHTEMLIVLNDELVRLLMKESSPWQSPVYMYRISFFFQIH